MLPHYQNRSLEYDQRIDRQINQRLKKKYANLAPVNFTASNPDAEAVFTNLEKTLFLIFALLQEAQTYLFEAPNHENDITEHQSDYTQPSSIDYSDDSTFSSGFADSSSFDRNSQFEARRRQQMNDDLSSASSFGRDGLNLNDITKAQRVVSTVGAFRGTISKIIQLTPSLTSLVKQITPLYSYLSQTQVDTIQQIALACINMFAEIYKAVGMDLGESNKDKSILFKSLDLIFEGIITKNLTLLGRLYQSYNPIVVPANVSGLNDTQQGYSLANGVDEGQYV
jgi:hypothetical protein